MELEKQLKGGGVFDGVGVRVEVYVATPEGDGGDEGEGWADDVTEKLGRADREEERVAEGESSKKRSHKTFATKANSRMAVKKGLGSPSAQSRR